MVFNCIFLGCSIFYLFFEGLDLARKVMCCFEVCSFIYYLLPMRFV